MVCPFASFKVDGMVCRFAFFKVDGNVDLLPSRLMICPFVSFKVDGMSICFLLLVLRQRIAATD